MTVQTLAFNYIGLNVKPINRVMYEKERSTSSTVQKTSRSVSSGLKINSRRGREFLNLIIHDCEFSKSSDIDQLILTLIFRFEVISVQKKMDAKFSRVFIRYKDTH